MTTILTAEAEEALRDIYSYIALRNPTGAWNVYDAITQAIDHLEDFPEMWATVTPESEMRRCIVHRYPEYSIYYRIIGDDIVVSLVYSTRQEHQPFVDP